MKVVLDTNVVVSGLLHSEGNPGQILALALSGAVQICHDEIIFAEYLEVLSRPRFKLNPERVKEILTKIETDGTSVSTGAEKWNLPDADDIPFLAVTFAASADHLVTGNIRHYPAAQRKGCSVVTPAEFMEIWRRASR
jgi:putative PIN family toxin of toxin-antitoxin system